MGHNGRTQRRVVPVKIVTILLAALAFPMFAVSPTPTGLVGSWRLISYEDKDANNNSVFPYGKTPAGLLIYDDTGHMSAQMMKTPPPDVASDDWDQFTVQEKVALFDGYAAYFGRYEVDETRHLVTHLAEADLSRLYIGRREERHYQLEGDRLILSETWTQSGKKWSGVRLFQRCK
jgi:Lipocalin-like domain